MKKRIKRMWRIFHAKRLYNLKLRIATYLSNKNPGKYCWADCVAWAYSCQRLNPFKIDKATACEKESIEHSTGCCYCGGWMNGKCYDLLSKEEKDAIIKQHESLEPEFPF